MCWLASMDALRSRVIPMIVEYPERYAGFRAADCAAVAQTVIPSCTTGSCSTTSEKSFSTSRRPPSQPALAGTSVIPLLSGRRRRCVLECPSSGGFSCNPLCVHSAVHAKRPGRPAALRGSPRPRAGARRAGNVVQVGAGHQLRGPRRLAAQAAPRGAQRAGGAGGAAAGASRARQLGASLTTAAARPRRRKASQSLSSSRSLTRARSASWGLSASSSSAASSAASRRR